MTVPPPFPLHAPVKLELLGEKHLEALLPFIGEYHAFEDIHMAGTARRAAVSPLLGDAGPGAVWAISEAGAWIGYVALTWGYSIEMRGRDAFIDEFYIRQAYRGRGVGTLVLREIKSRAEALGIRALHLEVDRGNTSAQALYAKLGFRLRGKFSLMTTRLDTRT